MEKTLYVTKTLIKLQKQSIVAVFLLMLYCAAAFNPHSACYRSRMDRIMLSDPSSL